MITYTYRDQFDFFRVKKSKFRVYSQEDVDISICFPHNEQFRSNFLIIMKLLGIEATHNNQRTNICTKKERSK
jgi:hypothetical protein